MARHQRRFDARGFVQQATDGLDALEMKARALQICAALEACKDGPGLRAALRKVPCTILRTPLCV